MKEQNEELQQIDTLNIKNIKAVLIDKSIDPNVTNSDCISEMVIEYENGTSIIVDAGMLNDIDERKAKTTLFKKCLTDSELNTSKNENNVLQNSNAIQLVRASSKKQMAEYQAYCESLEKQKKNTLKVASLVAGAAILATAGAIGGAALAKNLNSDKADEIATAEDMTSTETEVQIPSMEGQDWEYYVENAIDSTQKQAWTTVGEWLLNFNNSQSWMTRINNESQESVFGFSPEEAMAFYVRFNDFTDEELITIFNGTNINADEIMDLSNDFIEKMIVYYSVSDQTSGIESLFNDEHDKEVVKVFEAHHASMMVASETEKEALMQEEKQMFVDYFNSDINGKETKARAASTSFILRSILNADESLSDVREYKDTINIYKVGSGDIKEIKTDLFNEVFMATYVSGFEDFDEDHYLKQLGYSSEKYYLGIDGTKSSIADLSCGEQEEKLRDADEYKVELETSETVIEDNRKALEEKLTVYVDEDGKIDASQVADAISNIDFSNEKTTIDQLTKYSYNPELIADMLSNKLKENNKYPVYSDTFYEYYTELVLKYMNANTKTSSSGISGKVVKTLLETSNRGDVKNKLISLGDTAEEAEKKIVAAEEAAAKAVGAERDTAETKAKHEALAAEEQKTLQADYDTIFKHFASGNTNELTEYSNSTDENVRNTYNLAKQDGLNNLYTTVYNNTYNYYNQGGSGEYNSSYASSSNSTISSAYSKGKADGKAAYNKRQAQASNTPSYVQPGSVTTDPTGNSGTVQDVIDKSNAEDSNKDVVTPTPSATVTPEKTEVPTVEPAVTPAVNPTTTPDYSPIVDESTITNTDDTYFSEEDIINQFILDTQSDESFDSLIQSSAGDDQVIEEETQKVK